MIYSTFSYQREKVGCRSPTCSAATLEPSTVLPCSYLHAPCQLPYDQNPKQHTQHPLKNSRLLTLSKIHAVHFLPLKKISYHSRFSSSASCRAHSQSLVTRLASSVCLMFLNASTIRCITFPLNKCHPLVRLVAHPLRSILAAIRLRSLYPSPLLPS